MRHQKIRTRLGRQPSHRLATLKGLARSILLNERIKTTHAKAKEARKVVERLITIAKEDSLPARRKAFSILGDKTLVGKLFKEIAPLFKTRLGGYTRIIPYNFRKGDGASVVFLELTEKKPEEKPKQAKKPGKAEKPREKKEAEVKIEEVKKAPHKAKAAPEIGQKIKEEKTVEEVKKEKAKEEVRKIEAHKNLLTKIKGFFRRRTNM